MSAREREGSKKKTKQATFIWHFLVHYLHAHANYLATLSAAANMPAKFFNTGSAAKEPLRMRVAFCCFDKSANVLIF